MKVSTKTRYAIRFLIELALHEHEETNFKRLTTEQISINQGISEKYLEAIAAKLKKAGYIHSVRGVNGGYSLAQSPDKIIVGDVMKLMESTFFSVHCIEDYENCCSNYPGCVLTVFWEGLEDTITQYVNSLTVEDIKQSLLKKKQNPAAASD